MKFQSIILTGFVLFLSLSFCAAQKPDLSLPAGWRTTVNEDFDAEKIDTETWSLIPDPHVPYDFPAHNNNGKAFHITRELGNAGLATAMSSQAPYRLFFDFLQPANEASGYRLVVSHAVPEGNSWWFEFDKTSLGVFTLSEGGWANRWGADNLASDTWYQVMVEDNPLQVRFTIFDEQGTQVTQSDWISHDLCSAGSITFRADSGGGLRGVTFDNILLQQPQNSIIGRNTTNVDIALHQAMDEAERPVDTPVVSLKTEDGLDITLDGNGNPQRLELKGKNLLPADADFGGFWAWDVSEMPKYHRFVADQWPRENILQLKCIELGLILKVTFEASADCITLTGNLHDLQGADRGIVLLWALPVMAEEWNWGDELNNSRNLNEQGRYQYVMQYGLAGKTGSHQVSPYPWSSLCNDKLGLMVARPMDWPRLSTTFFDLTDKRQFIGMRTELGLSKATLKFPSQASFRWVLSSVAQPQWGFRSTAEKYYQLFPEFFEKRITHEGIWHLWVTTEIEDPETFGLVLHEQEPYMEDRIKYDNLHDAYSFTYSEPNTLWQHTSAFDENQRFAGGEFLKELIERSRQPLEVTTTYPFSTQPKPISDAELAQAALNCYIGSEGAPDGYPAAPERIGLNCNGDPDLPAPSRASLWFDYEGQPALNDPRVEGAYIDSVGWSAFDAAENMRREQWATADIPLGVSFRSGTATQLGMTSSYEIYDAISKAMHDRGKLVQANTFPFSHVFYAHLIDALGAGEAGTLEPFHEANKLAFCRTLSYQKPLSHMNYAYFNPAFSVEDKEKAIQRNLIYGVWPGSGNVFNSAQLDSVRPLYKKYVPLLQQLAKAGWEPVTYARISPDDLLVERFGKPGSEEMLLVVHNPTEKALEGSLILNDELLVTGSAGILRDLITGQRILVRDNTATVKLEPFQSQVLSLRRQSRP